MNELRMREREAELVSRIAALEEELLELRLNIGVVEEAEVAAAEAAEFEKEAELEALYHKRTYPAPPEEPEEEEEEEPSQWYPAYWREYYPSGN